MTRSTDRLQILQEIASKFSDGVVIFNLTDQRIDYINEAAKTTTNLTLGARPSDIEKFLTHVSDDDRKYLRQRYEAFKLGLPVPDVEFTLLKDSKAPVHLCVSAYNVLDNQFSIFIIRDISKNKDHENYLVEFGTKKNTILDMVVHMISGSIALTQHLSTEAGRSLAGPLNDNVKAYLDLINDNSKHCLEVVRDLLDQEHGRSPWISVKTSRINVVEKVGYIFEKLRASYERRPITFTSSVAEIFMNVDELKLLQIINNFVSNSIKFTTEKEPISIAIAASSTQVIISVADRGIGIPDELKPFIFDRETIAGRPGLNGEPSQGLGLYVCRQLALLLKGSVWFESNETDGTTFYLSLPIE